MAKSGSKIAPTDGRNDLIVGDAKQTAISNRYGQKKTASPEAMKKGFTKEGGDIAGFGKKQPKRPR